LRKPRKSAIVKTEGTPVQGDAVLARVQFDRTEELIDIRYDNVFKAVFTRDTPESLGALSRLVSALIGRDVAVLGLVANEPPVDSVRDRQIRYDINCRTRDGKQVNVEMSLNPDSFEPVRLEFHAGKLFAGQDIRGRDGSGNEKTFDLLKPTYQITVLARRRFFGDGAFLHAFAYYDAEHGTALGGRTRIITVELSKLGQVVGKPTGEMSAAELWAVFFRYLTDRSRRGKINEILEREEGIAMAGEVLRAISRDEHERIRLMSEMKAELDRQSKRGYAQQKARQEGRRVGRKEGREEGREEGLREGQKEIARRMKNRGRSLEEIAEDTGLDMESIKRL
jgi:predicted transposase/invertase (TIGR01784 family)